MGLVKVERALISVSDKKGVLEFAKSLTQFGVEILSTGGTARTLREGGVEVKDVAEMTGFPEILDGRVKTLHPAIFGGILADRSKKAHLDELKKMGLPPIDLVVVNLYPFKEVISKPDAELAEVIENIDIGGVALIRAAAKNYQSVAVVVDNHRYDEVIQDMEKNDGAISAELRLELAKEAFEHTADYDETIHHFLVGTEETFPGLLSVHLEKVQDLRYGENPHQKAALYREIGAPKWTLVYGEQLHGKEMSFNNFLDMDGAWLCLKEFAEPACIIVKHTNPCGAAVASNLMEAYEKALASDPVSAFGGIVAINRVVEEDLARKIAERFYEIVVAPAFTEESLEVLMQKKNVRLIYMKEDERPRYYGYDFRRVEGGLLVQDYDLITERPEDFKVVTEKQPTQEELEDLFFVWRVARHVKSNAIILGRGGATVGVGAGQMSRIDAFWLAARKAGDKAKGSVLASDAFFPFPDVVEAAAQEGITAIIQPGGALRDQESIDACNRHGIAMVFTGRRHFRH
jgi:phosphoribosylaminoimidazolecarboxamide formyltransferase/IMP cyclohydrolase